MVKYLLYAGFILLMMGVSEFSFLALGMDRNLEMPETFYKAAIMFSWMAVGYVVGKAIRES